MTYLSPSGGPPLSASGLPPELTFPTPAFTSSLSLQLKAVLSNRVLVAISGCLDLNASELKYDRLRLQSLCHCSHTSRAPLAHKHKAFYWTVLMKVLAEEGCLYLAT